ncbi:MAG: mercuric transporter MerT family protein [Candidatus Eisenbacteria bacterium]
MTPERQSCPSCDGAGKPVKPITIESLVVDAARARVRRTDGFRFCAEPSCAIAYFHPATGTQIAKSEVRIRIGQKATESPRPVCYCFEHTVEEIEAEVLATGTSKIADEITEKCRQGLDRCEETNPQGSCCLGNVRRAMKQKPGGQRLTVLATTGEPESCCVVGSAERTDTPPGRPRNTGLWATTGAIVSAILSSACCWLPLLLIAFGASAAGVAGFFEVYRPHLLGATGLLLASGFYLVHFRKEKCGPGEACAVPNPRLRRFNKIMLWVATVVVFTFALFPNYVGYLLGNGDPHTLAASPDSGKGRVFQIEGMTCEACAVTLREHLGQVPGVARAAVSFEGKTATAFFAEGQNVPTEAALLEAIQEAGYSGTPVARSRTVRIAVSGMTCAGCASGLQAQLRGITGIESARIEYESARATVTIHPGTSLDVVLQAIAEQGFTGKVEQ